MPEGTGRFDYVRYDDKAQAQQNELKKIVTHLGEAIDRIIAPSRERSLAQTKLEESTPASAAPSGTSRSPATAAHPSKRRGANPVRSSGTPGRRRT